MVYCIINPHYIKWLCSYLTDNALCFH